MFFKNNLSKQVNKPIKYKVDHGNISDYVIIAKKKIGKPSN